MANIRVNSSKNIDGLYLLRPISNNNIEAKKLIMCLVAQNIYINT